MSDSERVKQYGERVQEKKLTSRDKYRREVIKNGINISNEALAVGKHHRVAVLLDQALIPALQLDEWSLDQYHMEIVDTDLPWFYEDLSWFIEEHLSDGSNRFVTTLSDDHDLARSDWVALRASGMRSRDEEAREVIERAFESVESIAKVENHIQSELNRETDVYGHALRLGTLFQPWEVDSPESINLVNPEGHPPFTTIQGLPGFGKSTFIETINEDRWLTQFVESGDTVSIELEDRIIEYDLSHTPPAHKIIEFDIDELEGGLYDVQNQRKPLKNVRRDMDAPVWWDDIFVNGEPVPAPNVEIYVPLTRELAGSDLPYNKELGEFTAVPFTIPAADLNRRALSTLLSHTTNVQANFLNRAWQRVTKRGDWTLSDLAEEVWMTDAQEGVKKRITNALMSLQEVGFIRDKTDPWALEWEEVFLDTETITVFSTSLMRDTDKKMMVLAYLLDAVYDERRRLQSPTHGSGSTDLPRLSLTARELHFYAPTDRAAKEDPKEEELQDAMSAGLQELAARHRHTDTELNTDTQQFAGQVKKRIRDHVERVISFRAHRNTVEEVFSQLIGGKNDQYVHSISRNFDIGTCAAVGYTGSNRPFEMPIKALPPMAHHYDARKEDSGWTVRVENLDHEEFRRAPWSADIPDRLQFGSSANAKPEDPIGKFVYDCVSLEGVGSWELTDDILLAYNAYARDNNLKTVGKREIGIGLPGEVENKEKMREGHTFRVYEGLVLNRTGEEYLDHAKSIAPDNGVPKDEVPDAPEKCDQCGHHLFTKLWETGPNNIPIEFLAWVCQSCGTMFPADPDEETVTWEADEEEADAEDEETGGDTIEEPDIDCCDDPDHVKKWDSMDDEEPIGWYCRSCNRVYNSVGDLIGGESEVTKQLHDGGGTDDAEENPGETSGDGDSADLDDPDEADDGAWSDLDGAEMDHPSEQVEDLSSRFAEPDECPNCEEDGPFTRKFHDGKEDAENFIGFECGTCGVMIQRE